jgi:hypothetical protein
MKMTLNFSQFIDNWPESRKDQFSYNALRAIFEAIDSIEEDTGIETEYDPIAICCDWREYESAMDAAKKYSYEEVVDLEPHGSVDLLEVAELEEKQAREWLENRTTVLDAGKKIVIRQF